MRDGNGGTGCVSELSVQGRRNEVERRGREEVGRGERARFSRRRSRVDSAEARRKRQGEGMELVCAKEGQR